MKYLPYTLLVVAAFFLYSFIQKIIVSRSLNLDDPIIIIVCIVGFFVWRNYQKKREIFMLIKRANSCLTLSVFLIDWYVTIDLCFPSRMTRKFLKSISYDIWLVIFNEKYIYQVENLILPILLMWLINLWDRIQL